MALQVVRDVGFTERYCIALTNMDFYHNFIVANKLKFCPSTQKEQGPPSFSSWTSPQEWAQLLLDPVTQLLGQHTTLSVAIEGPLTGYPKFVRLKSINLEQLIRVAPIATSAEVGRILEQEHNSAFNLSDQTSPLWRLVIAPIADEPSSFYMIVVPHHAALDGRSSMVLSEQLIERLNLQARRVDSTAISRSGNTTNIPVTSTNLMPPLVEKHVDCKPSLRTMVSTITQVVLIPRFIKRYFETKYWAGEVDVSRDQPRMIELELIQLTTQETSRLIQASRRHSTTIHSMLHAASAFAVKSVFMSSNEGDAIAFATTVCLRNLISPPIPRTDLGNWSMIINNTDTRVHDESGFWDIAQAYKKKIKEGTTARSVQGFLEFFGMLGYLSRKDGDYEKALYGSIDRFQHGRESTVYISNIGRGWNQFETGLTSDEVSAKGDEFLVKDAIFSNGVCPTSATLMLGVATANGALSVSVTWQKASLKGRARGELFARELKRVLLEAIEDERDDYRFKDSCREYAI